jgi:hypothetical protein
MGQRSQPHRWSAPITDIARTRLGQFGSARGPREPTNFQQVSPEIGLAKIHIGQTRRGSPQLPRGTRGGRGAFTPR